MTVPNAEIQIYFIGLAILLTTEGELVGRLLVCKGLVPRDAGDEFLQIGRRSARRVEAADNGPHTRSGDAIDGDTHVFQDLQDADMGDPPGPPAAQDQTNPGTFVCLGFFTVTVSCGKKDQCG